MRPIKEEPILILVLVLLLLVLVLELMLRLLLVLHVGIGPAGAKAILSGSLWALLRARTAWRRKHAMAHEIRIGSDSRHVRELRAGHLQGFRVIAMVLVWMRMRMRMLLLILLLLLVVVVLLLLLLLVVGQRTRPLRTRVCCR